MLVWPTDPTCTLALGNLCVTWSSEETCVGLLRLSQFGIIVKVQCDLVIWHQITLSPDWCLFRKLNVAHWWELRVGVILNYCTSHASAQNSRLAGTASFPVQKQGKHIYQIAAGSGDLISAVCFSLRATLVLLNKRIQDAKKWRPADVFRKVHAYVHPYSAQLFVKRVACSYVDGDGRQQHLELRARQCMPCKQHCTLTSELVQEDVSYLISCNADCRAEVHLEAASFKKRFPSLWLIMAPHVRSAPLSAKTKRILVKPTAKPQSEDVYSMQCAMQEYLRSLYPAWFVQPWVACVCI